MKFHPVHEHLLVSGSLDYNLKLWDTDLGICLQTKDFGEMTVEGSGGRDGVFVCACRASNLVCVVSSLWQGTRHCCWSQSMQPRDDCS